MYEREEYFPGEEGKEGSAGKYMPYNGALCIDLY